MEEIVEMNLVGLLWQVYGCLIDGEEALRPRSCDDCMINKMEEESGLNQGTISVL